MFDEVYNFYIYMYIIPKPHQMIISMSHEHLTPPVPPTITYMYTQEV